MEGPPTGPGPVHLTSFRVVKEANHAPNGEYEFTLVVKPLEPEGRGRTEGTRQEGRAEEGRAEEGRAEEGRAEGGPGAGGGRV